MHERPKALPVLQVGERIRHDGGTWEVYRVTPCAAYIRSKARRVVTVEDRETGEPRTFVATESRSVAISRRSMVERIERGVE